MLLRSAIFVVLSLQLAGCAIPNADDRAIDRAMTDQDVALAQRLLQRTLEYAPDGTTRRWQNDESGHSGAITPVSTYLAEGRVFCRDYREEVRIAGRSRAEIKAACRDRLARWISL